MRADGSRYGAPVNAHAAAVLADVHRALCSMGFKDREARAMVDDLRTHMGAVEVSLQDALRYALRASAATQRSMSSAMVV